MKLNIKTINRYYNIFRAAIRKLVANRLKITPEVSKYIGYMKGEYEQECYFNVYKVNEKTFLFSALFEKPVSNRYAMHDEDFNRYLCFLHARFSKFHGLTAQSYYSQLSEGVLRYNYDDENLFAFIWKQL